MARRRYQKGSLLPKKGLPRWREDVIQPNGTITRPYKWETLGTIQDYPTREAPPYVLSKPVVDHQNSPTLQGEADGHVCGICKPLDATVLSPAQTKHTSAIKSQLRRWLLLNWALRA